MAGIIKNYHSHFRQALIVKNTEDTVFPGGCEMLKISDHCGVFLSDGYTMQLDEKGSRLFSDMNDGDIVSISEQGVINQIFSIADSDATIFMTGNCNSNCIMCPASDHERKEDYGDRRDIILEYIRMLPHDLKNYVVTGGEPTMHPGLFLDIMQELATRFPKAEALLLTNGRSMSVNSFVEKMLEHCPPFLTVAVPLHASSAELHDKITNSKDSFEQTIKGIHNLLNKGVSVEIRIVVSKLNRDCITELCSFIKDTYSRVLRVNFIGLEVRGNCYTNRDITYISPRESFQSAKPGIKLLIASGIDVGLYNYPLCCVDEGYRFLCKQSISPEKVRYAPECEKCTAKSYCGGLFISTLKTVHPEVYPIR